MLDLGDFAIGNVRIRRELRRRRNGRRSRDARHRGNVGRNGNVGNVNVVGNIDNLGNVGHDGVVGNVRLRLKQCCFIVDSNVNVAHNAGRRRSNRNSVGIFRNWQSRGEFRSSGTDDKRIADCGYGTVGANDAHCHVSAHRFISHDNHRWKHSSWE